MDLLKNFRRSSLHMKLMDFLNKSIEVLEKQIKYGVNFQNLVSGGNLALTWYFNYKKLLDILAKNVVEHYL